MIRAIIWDVGNVLIRYIPDYICLRLARLSGLKKERMDDKIENQVRVLVFGKPKAWGPAVLSYHYDIGDLNTAEFIREIRRVLKIDPPPCGPPDARIEEIFDRCFEVDHEIIRLLWFLSKPEQCGREITQGILSNINQLQFGFTLKTFRPLRLREPKEDDELNNPPGVMDVQIVSYKEKMAKPSRGIYAVTFSEVWRAHFRKTKQELKLHEVLYLDDRAENVSEAEEIGWHAEQVETYGHQTIFPILERYGIPLPPDDYIPLSKADLKTFEKIEKHKF